MSESNPMLAERRTEKVPLYPPSFRDWLAAESKAIDQMETEAASDRRKRRIAMKMAEDLDEKLAHPENIPGVRMVVVGAIAPRREQRLLDEHPPRKKNSADNVVGYNRETFRAALMRLCLVEPELTEAQFEEWVESGSTGEFEKVWAAVNRVQYGVDEAPKSSAVSLLHARRETASRQQPDTE
jgi:hypothetical protein